MVPATSDGRSVELYVRSLSPAEPAALEHARRVRALAEADRVANATVTVWGDEVGLSTTAFRTPTGRCILDRVAEIRAWAEETNVEVLSFFESRTVDSRVTGETYAALRLPVCCLVESVTGDVVHAAPHRMADGTVSVADRLDDLGESAEGAHLARSGGTRRPDLGDSRRPRRA